ncbi:TniB family NTP-binding protein [Nostoc sp. 'Peltigera membranacea cyanobiont' 232]|uniref:TniB family NTP-binding protein n=1 Tax=Nostoc sp. 'Peltigera membranacea cyanobiont' 232 TaxID=2014531 RepID=UPI001CB8D5B5|nr:TniB family NTP-binding protein [Nostoc sp. 'Peltigera membranacea cyanobiont' 232]
MFLKSHLKSFGLKGFGVEMLIIDEADRFKPKTFAEVRDIFDRLEIAVILVGTDRLDAVIKRDEQVYNRFRSCHGFGKMSGEDFKRTVDIWEKQILRLPVASNLSSKTMLKTLGEATGGYKLLCLQVALLELWGDGELEAQKRN